MSSYRQTPDGALAWDPASVCRDCGASILFAPSPRNRQEHLIPVEAAGFAGQFEITFHPSGDYHGRWIPPGARTVEAAPYYRPHNCRGSVADEPDPL